MNDYLQNLRLQQLFGNMGMPVPPPTFNNMFGPNMPDMTQSPVNTQQPDMNAQPVMPDMSPKPAVQPQGQGQGALSNIADIASRVAGMYKPQTDASDRFDKMQTEYPKENKPSVGRRIGGAALGSLGAINNLFDDQGNFHAGGSDSKTTSQGQSIFDQFTGKDKHQENIADWKNQIVPAQQAATIEKQNNSNERQAAYQSAALELRNEAQTAKEANDAKKTQIAEHRASVYEFKAKHPGIKFDFKGPTVIATDPLSGEVVDTGIDTGSMSAMDRLNLMHDNKMEEIDRTSENNSDLQDKKGKQILQQIDERGDQSRQTKETPSGSTTSFKPATPAATRTQQIITARQIINTRPDLAPFITINGNDFKITPPAEGGFFGKKGPSKQQYDEINNAIYGGGSSNKPNTNTPNAPQAPKGWKYVPKPGGGWTAVKDDGSIH